MGLMNAMGLSAAVSALSVEANIQSVDKEEGIKLSKFSVLVDDICKRTNKHCDLRGYAFCNGEVLSKIIDPALSFVFNYENLNSYAKIIMDKAPVVTEWSRCHASSTQYVFYDIKELIDQTKEFVAECISKERTLAKYTFIFWSLMILAVDKTDEDEHISLICNFAKMLDVTEMEIEDMIYIVKLIFNKVDSSYDFQSDTVVEIFGNVLNKYNCEL